MLSNERCREILGNERVEGIIKKFQAKGINQDTTDRVLDYLACNKEVFPFIDNKLLEDRLVNNLQNSIVYEGMLKYGISEFKKTKSPMSAINKFALGEGYATGTSVTIKKWPIKFLRQREFMERRLDSVIRHELDHIATTTFMEPLSKEGFEKYLRGNISLIGNLFNKSEQPNPSSYEITQLYQKYGDRICKKFGIAGKHDKVLDFGSGSLNEGITEYKTKKLDLFANGKMFVHLSAYTLNTKIAKHMASKIGEEKFLNMHLNNDFAGITQSYMYATGKDGRYMEDFYKNLDIETGQEKVPAHVALMRKAQNNLGLQILKNDEALRDIREISQRTSLSL